MLIDLAHGRADLSATVFDTCVIGGGVAGITLAVKLGRTGRRVLLAEAGDRQTSAKSQGFYRGEGGNLENLPLDETRIRALGGSSHHWGGWCRALDAYDFTRSDLAADGAWPIGKADLDPYFSDAAAMLGISELSGIDTALDGADGNLQAIRMYFSKPPANLGANFFDELRRSNNVTLLLNAPFMSAVFETNRAAVNAIVLHDVGAAAPVICRAHHYVMAMGTIENVRQLLILNRQNGDRIGNTSGLLGRYYLQHLHQELGQFVILEGGPPARSGEPIFAFMASTEQYLRKNGRGAFRLYSTSLACSGIIDSFRNVVSSATCRPASAAGAVFITAEQIPNANSQILLTDKFDAFGQSRVKLDWRISDDDHIAMRDAALEFGRYLIRANIGRLKVNPHILAGDSLLQGWTKLMGAPGAAGHQMGGARMSHTASNGVIDRDCRVWGIDNLYLAGSGAMRNSGHATPTLTITQLALRLADTLNRRLTK
jgi:choline dehydrogenase-like flavoprotein